MTGCAARNFERVVEEQMILCVPAKIRNDIKMQHIKSRRLITRAKEEGAKRGQAPSEGRPDSGSVPLRHSKPITVLKVYVFISYSAIHQSK